MFLFKNSCWLQKAENKFINLISPKWASPTRELKFVQHFRILFRTNSCIPVYILIFGVQVTTRRRKIRLLQVEAQFGYTDDFFRVINHLITYVVLFSSTLLQFCFIQWHYNKISENNHLRVQETDKTPKSNILTIIIVLIALLALHVRVLPNLRTWKVPCMHWNLEE